MFASFVSLPTKEFLKFSLISSPPSGCSLFRHPGWLSCSWSLSETGGEERKMVLGWGMDLTFPKAKSRLLWGSFGPGVTSWF